MRFLIDACAGRGLATWLREQGHDVTTTTERGPDPGDAAILAWAVAEGRILVTIDQDFGALVFNEGAPHAGMIRLPDVPAGARIVMMGSLLRDHGEDELMGAVVTVRGSRVRISRPATS